MSTSNRKPHSDLAGYVSERVCHAECGGHIVIYDRAKGFDCDADFRWIVQHEPSGIHINLWNRKRAYETMKDAAQEPDKVLGVEMTDLLPEQV